MPGWRINRRNQTRLENTEKMIINNKVEAESYHKMGEHLFYRSCKEEDITWVLWNRDGSLEIDSKELLNWDLK